LAKFVNECLKVRTHKHIVYANRMEGGALMGTLVDCGWRFSLWFFLSRRVRSLCE
jgi:hypothetical protein